jgi:[acyl-carrier-protein] S-malonyltransferase
MNGARWAVLFPGQGVQYVGMGRAVAEASPAARAVFEEADAVLGYPLSRLMWEGPEDRLRLTEIQQPAILTVSVAVWRAVPWPSRPSAAVGLSLGEYSALVAAGLMSFRDALRVVEVRGRAMQAAVPDGTGGMTAVLGLDAATVEALCAAVAETGVVEPANYNSPGQIVVAGTVAGLDALEAQVKTLGGRAVRLPVSAPFHSRLLKPAEAPLAEALATVSWRPAAFPVVANVDGMWVTTGAEAVPRLIQQVSRPVLFEQAIRQLLAAGVDRFIEVGPGRSLTTLVRRIDRRAAATSVEGPESFAGALELA